MSPRRVVLIASVLVALGGGAAHARRGGIVVINTGDDILHLRDLPESEQLQPGFALGYRYDRFGLFWVDLWRSNGEFVVYQDLAYASLTDEEVATLGGASVPWGYHIPPGLLLILAALELLIVRRLRMTVRATLVVTGVVLVIAMVWFFKGGDNGFAIPVLLAIHHGASVLFFRRPTADEEASSDLDEVDLAIAEPRPVMPSPPRVETDPFRAPPRPPPIVPVKPAAPAENTPVVHDETAAEPSLLR